MGQHDGTETNAGERHAAQRFSTKLRPEHPHRQGLIPADALRAHAPRIETLPDSGCHSRLGVNQGEPTSVCQQGQAAAAAGRVTDSERQARAAGLVPRCRFVKDMPLHGSRTDGRVHGLEDGEGSQAQGHPCSGVTDLRGSQRPVSPRMRGGRARGKLDQATCHTLKHPGDNGAPHDGQGAPPLSVVFALRMRLACWVAQTPQRCWAGWRAVWAKLGSQRLGWERLRAWCEDERLDARRALLAAR
jgi:hypothetical protein